MHPVGAGLTTRIPFAAPGTATTAAGPPDPVREPSEIRNAPEFPSRLSRLWSTSKDVTGAQTLPGPEALYHCPPRSTPVGAKFRQRPVTVEIMGPAVMSRQPALCRPVTRCQKQQQEPEQSDSNGRLEIISACIEDPRHTCLECIIRLQWRGTDQIPVDQ